MAAHSSIVLFIFRYDFYLESLVTDEMKHARRVMEYFDPGDYYFDSDDHEDDEDFFIDWKKNKKQVERISGNLKTIYR